jgi:hypothetical protein
MIIIFVVLLNGLLKHYQKKKETQKTINETINGIY